MATVAGNYAVRERLPDQLSGTPRAHSIDRWIFVAMAVWYIAIVLTGFLPDSFMKVGMVQAGKRPPFPPILHVHAVLMGSFLLLLLAQATMMATGRCEQHKRVGIVAFLFVPALVIAGLLVAPAIYHQVAHAAVAGPPAVRGAMAQRQSELDNILAMQMSVGVMFPLFMAIGLRARAGNSGLHKRMMFLATAVPLAAAFARIQWLPRTLPASPVSSELYIVAAVMPMFLWDVFRNRRVHEAYWIWLAVYVPISVLIALVWDKPWWHATARSIMGV